MTSLPRAYYMISIDGSDVTSNFDPVLINLRIPLTDGGKSDTLEVTLDDSYGRIAMPRIGASVTAMLAWSDGSGAVFFQGKTDEPESEGSRGGGMTLRITARATDMEGKPKEKQQEHEDDKKFGDVAEKWGKKADLKVQVDDKLKSIKRSYWAMQNESFMGWGQRMAEELGATFKIMGDKAVFVPRNSGKSVTGTALGTVMATYGDNIISWSITPVQTRPKYQDAIVRYYDNKEAKWQRERVGITGLNGKVPFVETKKAADKDRAKNKAESNAEEAKRGKGGGQITIIGNPNAQAQTNLIVAGVRSGVDGTYRITTATHNYSRSEGWLTTCDLEQPQGEEGKSES